MRLWLISVVIGSCLLSGSTGCQALQNKSSSAKKESAPRNFLGKRKSSTREVDTDDVLDPLGARDGNRLLLDDLAPGQFATTMKIRMRGEIDEQAAQQAYAEGQRLYRQGIDRLDADPSGDAHQQYFLDAANQFRIASASWPDSQIEEDALYFEGESFFFSDRYVLANRAFEKLISEYSGTHYLDLAEHRRYAIAVYWLQLAEKSKMPNLADAKRPKTNPAGEARRVLHQIRIDDPTGKYADDATIALGKAFMQARRYYEAADTFEDLRRNYPGSKHQFTAHMLELESRLNGYQGKEYDDTPLKKADELMKTIVRQFPEEAQTQLAYLEKQASQIQNQIAERDYSLAQYFEGRGENRAAKIYYEKVAQKFKNTELGKTVEQQIANVAAKPPKPEQHAKWLVDIFPNPEDEKPVIQAGNNETILRQTANEIANPRLLMSARNARNTETN